MTSPRPGAPATDEPVVRKGEATRQAVLEQAVETASRCGLAGLTIGSLATQAGMSKSGLFAHFRSKEALQLRVLECARDAFALGVVKPALGAPRGEQRIKTLFESWLAVTTKGTSECLFVSASWEFDDQPGVVRDQLVQYHRDFEDAVAQMVRVAVAEGHFRSDAGPEQFAFELHGLMLGYFLSHRLLGEVRAEAMARLAFGRLLAHAQRGVVGTPSLLRESVNL